MFRKDFIKVKSLSLWGKNSYEDEYESEKDDVVRIRFPFAVTYYSIQIFKEMFAEIFEQNLSNF